MIAISRFTAHLVQRICAQPRRSAWLLALIHLSLAIAFSVVNPLGEAPDEADHWAYAVYLAQQGRLPQGPQVTQSKHPPAYHLGAAVVASLGEPDIGFLRANPDLSLAPTPTGSPNFFIRTRTQVWPLEPGPLAFHLARLYTALLSAATVLAGYGLVRTAFPHRPGFALTVTAALALWPEALFLGGAVNNDTPVALFSTLALWGGFAIARTPGPPLHRLAAGWWTPLALGLGLLTKLSAAAVWPVVALLLAWGYSAHPPHAAHSHTSYPSHLGTLLDRIRADCRTLWHNRASFALLSVSIFAAALCMAIPWFWRNWQLYADPLGLELARQTIDQRTEPWRWADTLWLVEGWFMSFWGKFGAVGHIPYPDWVYMLLAIFSLFSLAGLIRHLKQQYTRPSWPLVPVLLLGLTVVAVAGGIWRYSLIALGTDQGRLLFPALVPLITLFVLGLRAWIPPTFRSLAGLGLVIAMAALALYGLLGVLRPAYAPLSPPTAHQLAEHMGHAPAAPVRLGELVLIGYSLDSEPTNSPGNRLQLYWQSPNPPQEDWRTILRVVAEDGTLVWEWRRSPGAGRLSTDRWDADQIMLDPYTIHWPEWAAPGSYLVEVGLYPYGGEPVLPQPLETDLTTTDPTTTDPTTTDPTTTHPTTPAPKTTAPKTTAPGQHPYIYLGNIERATESAQPE